MTTLYNLADTLPKDAGGAKFAAWPDVSTSQLDFALPAGIGARTTSSKIFAALQVGTHVGGSKVDHPVVGVLSLAHFSSNASLVSTMDAVPVRGDDRGQIYISSLSMITCAMSGSTETITLASGLLYLANIAACGAVSAGQVAILNGGTSLAHLVFGAPNETLPTTNFGTGASFGSLRFERRNTVGTVYASFSYRNYGQG